MKKIIFAKKDSINPATSLKIFFIDGAQNLKPASCFWFFFLLVALFLPSQAAADQDLPNTFFLPLKINAPSGVESLAAASDAAMQSALAPLHMKMMPREEAREKLDYRGNWPPDIAAINALGLDRAIQYVAAGSLTKFGDKLSLDMVVYDLLSEAPPRYFFSVADTVNDLDFAIKQLITDVTKYTGRYSLISEIVIKGNTRTDSGAILRHIASQPGDRYDPDRLRADLKNVFQMGYFDDVQVDVDDTPKGKKVTFVVKEKAVIGQIQIEGTDEIDKDDVEEVITVSPNTIINTKEVRTSVQNIRQLYKEKGFYDTQVSAKLSYPKPDRVNIRFVIDEGAKVYIKEIKMVGNKAFSDKELMGVIETSEKGFFSWITESGLLKRDILDQDAARIAAFYHNNGYIEAKVAEPEVTHEGKWLYVTFNISEGERYRVGTINISGDLIESKDKLLKYVKLKDERYFSRKILHDDILRLTDLYAEKGFAFAEIDPEVEKNIANKRMDITINIHKGILVYVNRIEIKGNTRTRDKVIRREMKVKEGGIFDASAIRRSTQRLQRLEYFEEVNISPEQTAQEDLMDILVNVKEKPTGTFSIGAGYSSVDNLLFMAEISQNNFMGRGQRVALQANVSSKTTQYNLSFTEPHLNDTELLFGVDLYNWEREYDDYTKDSTGGALRFGYPVWEKWKAFFSYGYDDTTLSDVSENASQIIKDSQDIKITSYVKLGAQRDTRNRLYDASEGGHHLLTVKYAGGPLGGDSAFTKVEGVTSWYFPLFFETVYHIKGAGGYAVENSGGKLPVYEKFYLGGLNTIRGFESGKISPRDPRTGERIGGEKMWYMNNELIFPLVKEAGLKGLIFYDTGNVYGGSDSWDVSNLKHSVGLGFRWLSPMGPLRLEWGYNLDPDPDEDRGVWDFSIGGSF